MPAASDAYSLEELRSAEREVIAILYELSGIVLSRRRRRRTGVFPEIPSWGRRMRRSLFAEKAGGGEGPLREGAASPDTPLAFPVASGGDEEEREEAAASNKPRRHREWVEEQSSMVAKLSQETTHLLQQIGEYRDRLESSRTTNENLKQMQIKLKQERGEEEEVRKQKMQHTPSGVVDTDQTAAAASGRVALGLDLNVQARSPKEEAAAAAAWYRSQQMMYRAAVAAEVRRRRGRSGGPRTPCRRRRHRCNVE